MSLEFEMPAKNGDVISRTGGQGDHGQFLTRLRKLRCFKAAAPDDAGRALAAPQVARVRGGAYRRLSRNRCEWMAARPASQRGGRRVPLQAWGRKGRDWRYHAGLCDARSTGRTCDDRLAGLPVAARNILRDAPWSSNRPALPAGLLPCSTSTSEDRCRS